MKRAKVRLLEAANMEVRARVMRSKQRARKHCAMRRKAKLASALLQTASEKEKEREVAINADTRNNLVHRDVQARRTTSPMRHEFQLWLALLDRPDVTTPERLLQR
jgi:hypothetical protein